MSRIIYIVLLGFVCFSISCKKQGDEQATNDNSTVEQPSNKITAKEIEALRFADYALSDTSTKKISDWNQYQELLLNIEQLRLANFDFFSEEKSIVEEFLSELKNTVPDKLNTNAIQARLIALETSIYKLHGELVTGNNDKKNILQASKETLISFANLNFQMNKKFEKEAQNIQKPQ